MTDPEMLLQIVDIANKFLRRSHLKRCLTNPRLREYPPAPLSPAQVEAVLRAYRDWENAEIQKAFLGAYTK